MSNFTNDPMPQDSQDNSPLFSYELDVPQVPFYETLELLKTNGEGFSQSDIDRILSPWIDWVENASRGYGSVLATQRTMEVSGPTEEVHAFSELERYSRECGIHPEVVMEAIVRFFSSKLSPERLAKYGEVVKRMVGNSEKDDLIVRKFIEGIVNIGKSKESYVRLEGMTWD